MADQTGIEWADSTFNPWMGCTKVSPACDHCYAERDTARFGRVEWGAGKPRVRTSEANWRKPLQWNAKPFHQCAKCGWRGDLPDTLRCPSCNSCRFTVARRRVFCASLADVFDNQVDPQWRRDLFALIEATPNIDWLLLTKRIGNANRIIEKTNFPAHRAWPWSNVWLGATICNQAEADRDIPKLLATPAAVRFLSIEPMLGAIDLRDPPNDIGEPRYSCLDPELDSRVHWVICGGESGPQARFMHPDWVRSLRDQCAEHGVPFLFKQWGEFRPPLDEEEWNDAERRGATYGGSLALSGKFINRGGGMLRVGKKAAGRMLDGKTHTGFPSHG